MNKFLCHKNGFTFHVIKSSNSKRVKTICDKTYRTIKSLVISKPIERMEQIPTWYGFKLCPQCQSKITINDLLKGLEG